MDNLENIIREKNWYKWKRPVEISHWLPLLGEALGGFYIAISADGRIIVNADADSVFIATDYRYDFKKPLSEQSEELRAFLLENIK